MTVVSGAFLGLFQTSTPLAERQIVPIAVVCVEVEDIAQVLKESSTSAEGFGDAMESLSQKPVPLSTTVTLYYVSVTQLFHVRMYLNTYSS